MSDDKIFEPRERIVPFKAEIESIINKVRPYLLRDAGDIQFVGFENHVVKVRMKGSCSNCSIQEITIAEVEKWLKELVPSIERVEVVQDVN